MAGHRLPPPAARAAQRGAAALALAAALVLAGCANLPLPPGVRLDASVLSVGSSDYRALRLLPAAPPVALVVLAHGFARACANLRGTALRLAEAGAELLCLDAPMAGGNPLLAEALADALAHGWLDRRVDGGTPATMAAPLPVVAAGHSAGGAFAVHLAAALERRAPGRLAGVLLFDPVAADARFADDLAALRRVPVRAVFAPPDACNAQGKARAALEALPGFAAATPVDGATHLDAEGEDSGALARAACGTPRPAATEALRAQAVQWLRAMVPPAERR